MPSTPPRPPFKVCIVVPCYNEQGVISHTARTLLDQLLRLEEEGLASASSFICCVDDGSRDGTWGEIEQLAAATGRVKGIKLSANFGHPNALVAGLFSNRSASDILITIDADLQDDENVIRAMLEHHRDGKRVVYGVRLERRVDSLLKQMLAALYYRLMKVMNDRTIRGHADYRSADAGVIADLERFGEANLYLRGIFPLIGYPSAEVHFARKERHAGVSKYPLRKLVSLAWQGITSFTTTPLRMVFYIGLAMFLLAAGYGTWVLYAALSGSPIEGWASMTLLLITFSSFNLISLGVIGEYVGKIYKEVKQRPRYIIEATV